MITTLYIIENIAVSFYPVLDLWQQGLFIINAHRLFFVYSTYSWVIRHSTDIIKIALACFSAMALLFCS
jgi:hypothetical protein